MLEEYRGGLWGEGPLGGYGVAQWGYKVGGQWGCGEEHWGAMGCGVMGLALGLWGYGGYGVMRLWSGELWGGEGI